MFRGNVSGLACAINLIFFWGGKGFVSGGLVGPGKGVTACARDLKMMEGIDCPTRYVLVG